MTERGREDGQPPLSPRRAEELERARGLARVLDLAVRIPGTDFRVGLDALLGLIPGFGDVAGGLLSAYILVVAARQGASRPVLVRMLANVGLDALVGAIPVAGDLFDAAWKANARNMRLLERHLQEPGRTRTVSRRFLVGFTAGAVLLLVLLIAGAAALVGWLIGLAG